MKNKIVLFTTIFGGYDGLISQPKIKGVDQICFTDRDIKSHSWTVVKIEPELSDPVRNSRMVKILPHRYLNQYESSIYIDGNFLVTGNIDELIKKYVSDANMAAFDHNHTLVDKRDCIYDECAALLKIGKSDKEKDNPLLMQRQIERYRQEGYPEHYGLISGGVLIRRHNEPDVIRTMERWWCEIENGSRRDQLSFNYAVWKENFCYATINGDIRNNDWFYMLGIHRHNYFWKVFRYRLRKVLGISRR